MRILTGALLIIGLVPWARAEMWDCTDKVTGARTFTNIKAEIKGKDCKAYDIAPINTAPATRPAQKTANFPSVDSNTQKQRDAERRQLLEKELGAEQQQLDQARKELAEQKEQRLGTEKNYARVEERIRPFEDRVKRHESNIENLRKELANIK